jgi:hypothetical protein
MDTELIVFQYFCMAAPDSNVYAVVNNKFRTQLGTLDYSGPTLKFKVYTPAWQGYDPLAHGYTYNVGAIDEQSGTIAIAWSDDSEGSLITFTDVKTGQEVADVVHVPVDVTSMAWNMLHNETHSKS